MLRGYLVTLLLLTGRLIPIRTYLQVVIKRWWITSISKYIYIYCFFFFTFKAALKWFLSKRQNSICWNYGWISPQNRWRRQTGVYTDKDNRGWIQSYIWSSQDHLYGQLRSVFNLKISIVIIILRFYIFIPLFLICQFFSYLYFTIKIYIFPFELNWVILMHLLFSFLEFYWV